MLLNDQFYSKIVNISKVDVQMHRFRSDTTQILFTVN